jgi:hypothetical protein
MKLLRAIRLAGGKKTIQDTTDQPILAPEVHKVYDDAEAKRRDLRLEVMAFQRGKNLASTAPEDQCSLEE